MTRAQLIEQIRKKKSFLCVGLDSDTEKIPKHLNGDLFEFNKGIIDSTHEYCVAYKPNAAFYEAEGLKGWEALEKTVSYLRKNYPDHFVIADAKRGDIGNTSSMYARAFFRKMDCSAITVAPYMGEDSVTPFLEFPGKWVILLALTSNKGADDFQHGAGSREQATGGRQKAVGKRLFEQVIEKSRKWGNASNMMYVVGATRATMLEDIRRIAPDHFLLVPGVGAQGGSLEEVCRHGMNDDVGLLVNASRSIIYASTGKDYGEKAGEEARKLRDEMAAYLIS